MKGILLAIVLIWPLQSWAQDGDLQRVIPKWKVGDKRLVHTETHSKVVVDGQTLTDLNLTADYYLAVEAMDETHYTIRYRQKADDIELEKPPQVVTQNTDQVQEFVMEMFQSLQGKFQVLEYRLLVDRNTGLAQRVLNESTLVDTIRGVLKDYAHEIGPKYGLLTAEIDSLQLRMDEKLLEMQPQMLQTTLNAANLIFQVHSMEYKPKGQLTVETLIYNPNAMNEFGQTDFPANLQVDAKSKGRELTITMKADYNKEFLLEQLQKKHGSLGELQASDLNILEEEVVVFDRKTTWIKSHTSTVRFTMPQVETMEKTVITLSKP